MSQNLAGEIRLREAALFLELIKTRSIRELSRRHRLTPGQLSKSIKALEAKVGSRLFERSLGGITPTARAMELLPWFESLESHLERLSSAPDSRGEATLLTFASTTLLSTRLLPEVLAGAMKEFPQTRFRLFDLPPAQFVAAGMRSAFDGCVHTDELSWPRTWTTIRVGVLRWRLFCRRKHPLLRERASLLARKVVDHPFVYPVYWSLEGLRYGNDRCPIDIQRRIRGFETSTAEAAIEMVRRSDQIGLVPELVARELVAAGEVAVLDVVSWKPAEQSVHLTVRSDRFNQRVFAWLKAACSATLLGE